MNNIQKVSSQADIQNQTFAPQIEQNVVKDIKLIENLVQSGIMTQEQGQNLMNYVTQKAFDMYTQNSQIPIQEVKSLKTPDFFNQEGRMDVFDYLKNANVDFDDDEISKISSLVEKIENAAIDKYLRKQEHEKTLNLENESAKQRLRANAQNSVSDSTKNLVFTREQIGKMSGAEFAKHERAIMDQVKKGLIK